MRIKVNDDTELVNSIRQKLKENKEKYGKQYCPCVIPDLYSTENSDDYVCMCKEFQDMDEGECHCGLYIKSKEIK